MTPTLILSFGTAGITPAFAAVDVAAADDAAAVEAAAVLSAACEETAALEAAAVLAVVDAAEPHPHIDTAITPATNRLTNLFILLLLMLCPPTQRTLTSTFLM